MNKTIIEPKRDLPVAADVDLCVIGGSCTGVYAAVRAARLGLKVAIVEAEGFFGGMATAGLVCVWHPLLDTVFRREIIAGLTLETIERLDRRQGVEKRDKCADVCFVLNPYELMIVLDELITEAGVRPFLHARFAAPIVEDGRVTAAVIEDKTGRRAITARVFIDASGDGDLIHRAGLPTWMQDDLQPPTMCFVLHGYQQFAKQTPGFRIDRVVYDPRHNRGIPHGFLWGSNMLGDPDSFMIAGTRVPNCNCADGDELSRAEIEGRRQARAMLDILQSEYPQTAADLRLAALPAALGIRETRHCRARHQLTESEVLEGVRFDDAIANGSYRVDVHHSDRPGLTFRYLNGTEIYCVPGQPGSKGRWREERDVDPTFYQIPYRCLLPQGTRNVLAAGRLIDADRGAYGAVRVMVNCNQTGEAAGVAAYLACQNGSADVAAVAAADLRRKLSEGGSIII